MEAIKQDYEKAKKIYEINCDEYGMAHSCHKSGGYYFAGRGCPRWAQRVLLSTFCKFYNRHSSYLVALEKQ